MMKKKTVLKIAAAAVAVAATAAILFMNAAYVPPVIMYHSIDTNDRMTKLSLSARSLERQMAFLKRHNYNVVSLEKLAAMIRKGGKLPPRTIAITFDDGLRNNYEYAYPILKKYGLPATIFVIVSKIGTPGYLSWDEIKEMSDSGFITIGSHTLSHLWLPSLGTAKLKQELERSKEVLEQGIGKPVNELCYPIGAHNDRVKNFAKAAGYACAVGTNPGRFSPFDDIYAIKRVRISRTSDNPIVFWFETSGYYTWVKERRDD